MLSARVMLILDMTTRGIENVNCKTGRSADRALEAVKKMSPQTA